MKFDVIICASGESTRMGENKLKFDVGGMSVLKRSITAFYTLPFVKKIIVVTKKEEIDFVLSAINGLDKTKFEIAIGGNTRTESVKNGLQLASAAGVLIHDAARPFVSQEIIEKVAKSVEINGSGVPALAVNDSVRLVENDKIVGGFERDNLRFVQTPQGFLTDELKSCFTKLAPNESATDESELYARFVAPVSIVDGSHDNRKLTTMGDYLGANMRVGIGYDIHRLIPFKKLMLGGIEVEYHLGSLAHSDGDVVIHALIDALLSASGELDIGSHFPDNAPEYLDIDSAILLSKTMEIIKKKGYIVNNASLIIIAEAPKLADYIPLMRIKLARLMGISYENISIAAKTNEKVGEIGENIAIASYATVTLV